MATKADAFLPEKNSKPVPITADASDALYRTSNMYKVVCVCFMLLYHFGGFWLSRTRIEFLDNFTAMITPNFVSVATEASMNYLEGNFTHFQLATIWSVAIHQLVYWSLCLPDFTYQALPFMNFFKIQRTRFVPLKMQWECFLVVFFNQWVVEAPLFIFNYFFAEYMNYGFSYSTLPTWYQLIGAMVGCLALEDTWHYFMHSTIHQGSLYQMIHKVHHRFQTPIGMQAEYAHPLEVMLLGLGFMLGCGIYCNHFFATWLWMAVRQMETIEVHSGYDVPEPFNPFHLLPFYGGPRFHDFHHSNFKGNYSSTFTYWDSLFDTDVQFNRNEAKRALSKDA